jgi:hypothetical protein
VPAGVILLMDGTTPLGVLNLTGGSATYSTSSLPLGTDVITAIYSGELQQYAPSTSAALGQVVALTTSTTTTQTSSSSTATAASSAAGNTASKISTVTVASEHSKKAAKKVVVAHRSKPGAGSAAKFHHQVKPAAIKHTQIKAVAKHAKVAEKKK